MSGSVEVELDEPLTQGNENGFELHPCLKCREQEQVIRSGLVGVGVPSGPGSFPCKRGFTPAECTQLAAQLVRELGQSLLASDLANAITFLLSPATSTTSSGTSASTRPSEPGRTPRDGERRPAA